MVAGSDPRRWWPGRILRLFMSAVVRKASAGRVGTRPFAILYSIDSLSCLRRSSKGGRLRKSSILPMHPGKASTLLRAVPEIPAYEAQR